MVFQQKKKLSKHEKERIKKKIVYVDNFENGKQIGRRLCLVNSILLFSVCLRLDGHLNAQIIDFENLFAYEITSQKKKKPKTKITSKVE